MERLTEKRSGQNVIPLRQDGSNKWALCSAGMGYAPAQYLYGDHADRLAAYEDTGLTPEEIEELKKDAVKMKSLIAAYELNGCIGKRQLQARGMMSDEEKRQVYMGRWNIPKHPCEGCGTGWGSANSEEVHTCEETCEKLAAWNEQQKKEEDHGTADTKE